MNAAIEVADEHTGATAIQKNRHSAYMQFFMVILTINLIKLAVICGVMELPEIMAG
jgi:hypothetical protein